MGALKYGFSKDAVVTEAPGDEDLLAVGKVSAPTEDLRRGKLMVRQSGPPEVA
jgi:hypothetical protein